MQHRYNTKTGNIYVVNNLGDQEVWCHNCASVLPSWATVTLEMPPHASTRYDIACNRCGDLVQEQPQSFSAPEPVSVRIY